jgi:hypothetical protein
VQLLPLLPLALPLGLEVLYLGGCLHLLDLQLVLIPARKGRVGKPLVSKV